MSKTLKYVASAGLTACLPFSTALAEWELNMPVGVTELSREIYGLHMLIFWICVVIAVAVFGVMIYSIIAFRKSKGAIPANFDHSTKVEIIWTIIPIAILVGMAVPAAETLIKIEDVTNSQLTVQVTGYQWKWHYKYLNENVGFYSSLARESDRARQLDSGVDPFQVKNYLLDVDNPLVVPIGAKVHIVLTSNDVIHAWWVPAFGMKKDAVPGLTNDLWFRADEEGEFRGQCAELCGRDHGFMPIVVKVVSQQAFDSWVKQMQGAPQQGAAPATASLPSTNSPTATGSPLAQAE